MKLALCIGAGLLAGVDTALAQSATHYFTQGSFLYAYDGTQPLPLSNPVQLDVPMTALAFHPGTGELWAHSPDFNFNFGTFYTVDPITGVSTFQFMTPAVPPPIGQGGAFVSFGFRRNPVLGDWEIVGFNDRLIVDTYEIYGLDGVQRLSVPLGGLLNQSNHPAAGYDPALDVVYGVSSGDGVFTYDAGTGGVLNQSGGPLNVAIASAGGDFFDGAFWVSYNVNRGTTVEFGTLDPATAVFTPEFSATTVGYSGNQTTQGYAIRSGPICYASETAWGAGVRYSQRGNWATFTEYTTMPVPLYAGQTLLAGEIQFGAIDPISGTVAIMITLEPGFRFTQDGDTNLAIEDYMSAPSGNPRPGHFEFKSEQPGDWGYTAIVTVRAAPYYGIHAVVDDLSRVVPCGGAPAHGSRSAVR